MIAALTGELAHVDEDRIHLRVGPILYELLVPAADVNRLKDDVGLEMTFHTWMYFQGDSSGGNIEPRLIGFLRREDKKFFEKFITVKGIGPKKALKALAIPVGEIAQAIESKDARFLCELPEIGKRTAEQIVAELSGKMEEFATPISETSSAVGAAVGGLRRSPVEEDAIMALVSLGERRLDAERLLERVKQASPNVTTTQTLIGEMLRMRTVRG